MTTHVTAIYENGVLRPTKPLPLKEGERVQFTVDVPTPANPSKDALDRIRNAKSFDEWITAADEAAKDEPAGSSDLLVTLNETRRQAGERPLYPADRKGIDW